MRDIKINKDNIASLVNQHAYYIEGKYPHQKTKLAVILGAEPGLNDDIIVRIHPCYSTTCGMPSAPDVKYINATELYATLEKCEAAIKTKLDAILKDYTSELNTDSMNNDRIYAVVKFIINHDTRPDGTDPIAREIAVKYLTALGIEV